jgi:hypothetical protein
MIVHFAQHTRLHHSQVSCNQLHHRQLQTKSIKDTLDMSTGILAQVIENNMSQKRKFREDDIFDDIISVNEPSSSATLHGVVTSLSPMKKGPTRSSSRDSAMATGGGDQVWTWKKRKTIRL